MHSMWDCIDSEKNLKEKESGNSKRKRLNYSSFEGSFGQEEKKVIARAEKSERDREWFQGIEQMLSEEDSDRVDSKESSYSKLEEDGEKKEREKSSVWNDSVNSVTKADRKILSSTMSGKDGGEEESIREILARIEENMLTKKYLTDLGKRVKKLEETGMSKEKEDRLVEEIEKRVSEKLEKKVGQMLKKKEDWWKYSNEEKQERRMKKDNLIIVGIRLKDRKEVERFFREKLEVDARNKIKDIWFFKKNEKMIGVKCHNHELKVEIMKNKNKLRGERNRIYIDDDFTVQEREIQKYLKEEKMNIEREKKGTKVVVGIKKLRINGIKYCLDEERFFYGARGSNAFRKEEEEGRMQE